MTPEQVEAVRDSAHAPGAGDDPEVIQELAQELSALAESFPFDMDG